MEICTMLGLGSLRLNRVLGQPTKGVLRKRPAQSSSLSYHLSPITYHLSPISHQLSNPHPRCADPLRGEGLRNSYEPSAISYQLLPITYEL